LLFPKPVVIVAGKRRQPPRAAKSATIQAVEQLKNDKLQTLLKKPISIKASTASDVSSSYSKYNSLGSEVQHIRVDVIRGFDASLKWKIDLDCTLAASCITPIRDNRIKTIYEAKTVDFGGHCSFIHCPGLPMEEVLQNFSRAYDKDPEHTSAILAIRESDYNRLWSKLWHWKTLKSFKKGEWIFNHYEAGKLPRKCGLNAAYKILYCDPIIPEESIGPILKVGDLNLLMLFQAAVNDNKCRLGMDTMCQGPGFLTESFL
jgi:hypothetical protein